MVNGLVKTWKAVRNGELTRHKLAQQAENTSKLTLLAKSNAVRRGAKVKRAELQKIDEAIATHQL
jgi:hypothetical protein